MPVWSARRTWMAESSLAVSRGACPETSISTFLLIPPKRVSHIRFLSIEKMAMSWMLCFKSW
jgi:hypothetical protein